MLLLVLLLLLMIQLLLKFLLQLVILLLLKLLLLPKLLLLLIILLPIKLLLRLISLLLLKHLLLPRLLLSLLFPGLAKVPRFSSDLLPVILLPDYQVAQLDWILGKMLKLKRVVKEKVTSIENAPKVDTLQSTMKITSTNTLSTSEYSINPERKKRKIITNSQEKPEHIKVMPRTHVQTTKDPDDPDDPVDPDIEACDKLSHVDEIEKITDKVFSAGFYQNPSKNKIKVINISRDKTDNNSELWLESRRVFKRLEDPESGESDDEDDPDVAEETKVPSYTHSIQKQPPSPQLWRQELSTKRSARCTNPGCRLSFLSLAGVVRHHQMCEGFLREGDFLPCDICGERFKQFRSLQVHVDKTHRQ